MAPAAFRVLAVIRAVPPSWLQALGQWTRAGAARRFQRAVADPQGAQADVLRGILAANAETTYGRQHGFADLRDPDAYRAAVPIVTHADLRPLITRMQRGESGLLTAERPTAWLRTTGSAGVPKDVPLTPSYVRAYQEALMASLWHVYRRHPEGFRGRGGYLVGSPRYEVMPDGAPAGTMSGLNFQRMPALVRALYAWPPELLEVRHRPTQVFLTLLLGSLDEITLIGGIFPRTLVQLLEGLGEHAGELAEAARTATLPGWLQVPPALEGAFVGRLRRRPDVAARLAAAAKAPDRAVPLAWPHLRLIYCWTGGSAALYVPALQRLLGDSVAICDAVYSASEGWMNVPLGSEEPGGPLAVGSHFLEFVPEEAYRGGGRGTVLAHELQPGRSYVVVLTTQAGLYRYDLQDVVVCTGMHDRTPCIVFDRKVGAASSLVGELLEEGHVTRALARVGAGWSWATLVPVTVDPVGYDLWVEPYDGLPDGVADAVDRALCEEAFMYGKRRADGGLRPLAVRVVPPGTWRRVEQARSDAGEAVGQVKASHLTLSEDRLPPEVRAAVSG